MGQRTLSEGLEADLPTERGPRLDSKHHHHEDPEEQEEEQEQDREQEEQELQEQEALHEQEELELHQAVSDYLESLRKEILDLQEELDPEDALLDPEEALLAPEALLDPEDQPEDLQTEANLHHLRNLHEEVLLEVRQGEAAAWLREARSASRGSMG